MEARAHKDSRWYSGLGIYRDVHLVESPLAHIVDNIVRVTTPDVDEDIAVVEAAVPIRNSGTATQRLVLAVELRNHAGDLVAADERPVTIKPSSETTLRHRLYVESPELSSVENPHLYAFSATLRDLEGSDVTHHVDVSVGMRTLKMDPDVGFASMTSR